MSSNVLSSNALSKKALNLTFNISIVGKRYSDSLRDTLYIAPSLTFTDTEIRVAQSGTDYVASQRRNGSPPLLPFLPPVSDSLICIT